MPWEKRELPPAACHTITIMSQYIKNDNIISVSESRTLAVTDTLPLGTYTLELNRRSNEFYLKQMDDFKPFGKIYGDYRATVDRIITTFMSRSGSNLGVLLSGVKGSGKTLTAKMISVEMAKRFGYATIIINKGYDTAELSGFLRSINVPCMVLFDEFEKVYSYKESDDNASQSGLLDILDGVFESRKLFVMSCNNTAYINPYFFSRPGRIFYHYRYEGLTQDIISQYCDDRLVNPQWKSEILRLATFVRDMTFDILKAIVEESNRYNESPMAFIETLNVEYGLEADYTVELQRPDGSVITKLKDKKFLSFGKRSWYLRFDAGADVKALCNAPGSPFEPDDDDDDEDDNTPDTFVYGYYTPEFRDILSVQQDGTIRLSVVEGRLIAVLRRVTRETLDYAELAAKI